MQPHTQGEDVAGLSHGAGWCPFAPHCPFGVLGWGKRRGKKGKKSRENKQKEEEGEKKEKRRERRAGKIIGGGGENKRRERNKKRYRRGLASLCSEVPAASRFPRLDDARFPGFIGALTGVSPFIPAPLSNQWPFICHRGEGLWLSRHQFIQGGTRRQSWMASG